MIFCQKCATLNDVNNEKCSNCESNLNHDLFERLLPFAKNASYYGYFYRVDYENQVKESGKVSIKYSLLQPSNYFDFIAVAALTGYIGGVSHQIVNYIGKQIVDFIKTKINPDEKDNEFVDFFENKDKLERFTRYINDYYTGKHVKNRQVADAIIEEEMADFASHEKGEEFAEVLKNYNPEEQGELLELFTEIAKGVSAKRREIIPKVNDLKELYGDKKKELVKDKKKNKGKAKINKKTKKKRKK